MNDLVLKDVGQQLAFVDHEATGRTVAGLQKVRHHAGIVLMPVIIRPFVFGSAFALRLFPAIAPTSSGQFLGVAEIAELHHVIDAHAAVAIIIVVRLP